MEHTVLFVDDEESILEALRRVFRTAPYRRLFAASAQIALDLLRSNTVSVVVSDLHMPVMDGVQLMQKVRRIQPHAIRIILSALADRDNVRRAVGEGAVWRFVAKPWNAEDLVHTIAAATQEHERKVQPEHEGKDSAGSGDSHAGTP